MLFRIVCICWRVCFGCCGNLFCACLCGFALGVVTWWRSALGFAVFWLFITHDAVCISCVDLAVLVWGSLLLWDVVGFRGFAVFGGDH